MRKAVICFYFACRDYVCVDEKSVVRNYPSCPTRKSRLFVRLGTFYKGGVYKSRREAIVVAGQGITCFGGLPLPGIVRSFTTYGRTL